MVVPLEILELASDMWQAPDEAELVDYEIEFVSSIQTNIASRFILHLGESNLLTLPGNYQVQVHREVFIRKKLSGRNIISSICKTKKYWPASATKSIHGSQITQLGP